MRRVVVTGARTYFSLPVIRALGRRGVAVTAADWDRHALGFYSRFTRRRWIVPRVADAPEAFVDDLARRLRARPHEALIPLYEEALAIARYRDRLPASLRIALPDYATMIRLHDKRGLAAFAHEAGVATPVTRAVPRGATPDVDDLGIPLIVKAPQASSARGVVKVASRAALDGSIATMRREHALPDDVPVLVQQAIDGDQLCAIAFAWHGRPKGVLLYRNVVEYPEAGGAGIVRIGLRDRRVERDVERMLEASAWHGIAGFDFMVERDTGRHYLIDANPRYTPATLLALRSRFDLLSMALAAEEPAAADPRPGLRTRFDPLVALHVARSFVPQPRYCERVRAALGFLRRRPESRSDIFDPDDWCALRGLIPNAVDAIRACARGRSALDVVEGSNYCDYRTPIDVQ